LKVTGKLLDIFAQIFPQRIYIGYVTTVIKLTQPTTAGKFGDYLPAMAKR
jgi:hypothetical protein